MDLCARGQTMGFVSSVLGLALSWSIAAGAQQDFSKVEIRTTALGSGLGA